MNATYSFERRRLVPVPASRTSFSLALAQSQGWVWHALIFVLDAAAWLACFGAVFLLRVGTAGIHWDWASRLMVLALWPLAAIVLTLFIVGGYDRRTDLLSLTYMSEHLIGMVAALALASLLVYGFASYDFPIKPGRSTLFFGFVAFAPLSLIYRRAIGARMHADMARKHFLVLGSGESAQPFLKSYVASTNRQSLRFLDVAGKPDEEILAELQSLTLSVEGIVVTLPLASFGQAVCDQLVRLHFQQTPVFTLDTFYETYWRRVPVFALNPSWPLQLGFQLTRTSPYQHAKRLFDIVSAATGLLLLAPLLGAIALLTLWDSGRPVIFRQERVGRGGGVFTIFKFRSMKNRPADVGDDLYTRTNDSRITRVGKWLRKGRLDELPQLWNVLRGDMSLIGPRAEWVRCAELYEKNIPSYHFRHLVKPGITGWAQVNYAYGENEDDAIQKLKYDLYYIRRYSLRLDAMIVLKTLHIMFWGKGQ